MKQNPTVNRTRKILGCYILIASFCEAHLQFFKKQTHSTVYWNCITYFTFCGVNSRWGTLTTPVNLGQKIFYYF